MEVENKKGSSEIWNPETKPPAFLVRAGWKSTTIKPGDKIKVTARPFRNGDAGGLFVNLMLPDGRVLGNNAPRGGGPAAPVYEPKEPSQVKIANVSLPPFISGTAWKNEA